MSNSKKKPVERAVILAKLSKRIFSKGPKDYPGLLKIWNDKIKYGPLDLTEIYDAKILNI